LTLIKFEQKIVFLFVLICTRRLLVVFIQKLPFKTAFA